jgi:very-short-patch-repair endonuclease
MQNTQTPGYIYDLCRKLRQKSTDTEKHLWEYLRTKRLNGLKFRRQHPIGRYIADFYCREARLAIELDGRIHQFKDQKEYDKARQEIIEVRGIRVLRVKNEEIEQSIESVVRKISSLTSPP